MVRPRDCEGCSWPKDAARNLRQSGCSQPRFNDESTPTLLSLRPHHRADIDSGRGISSENLVGQVRAASKRQVPLRYRLTCSSRNITTANTWECGVVLDGVRERGGNAVGASLSAFLRWLSRQPRGNRLIARALAREV